jgi:hypothetical protein
MDSGPTRCATTADVAEALVRQGLAETAYVKAADGIIMLPSSPQRSGAR